MSKLILPEEIKINLIRHESHQSDPKKMLVMKVRKANVILHIRFFASFKSDYILGPFVSNEDGEFTIFKEDLKTDIETLVGNSLMEYRPVDDCFSMIEIYYPNITEIENRIKMYENYTFVALNNKRWRNNQELVDVYMNCENLLFKNYRIANGLNSIRDDWDKKKSIYEYEIHYFYL